MRRFAKIGAIVLAATLALTAVIGTTVFADSPGEGAIAGDNPMYRGRIHGALGAINAELAAILGVDEEVLVDAFRQALQEIRDEIGELDEGVKPKDLVIASVAASIGITEEQLVDAIEQAMQNLQAKVQERIQERHEKRLQDAVANGTITEDEADQIREWWESRPAALEKLRPIDRPQGRMGDNGRFGNGGLWQNGQGSEDSAEDLAPTAF